MVVYRIKYYRIVLFSPSRLNIMSVNSVRHWWMVLRSAPSWSIATDDPTITTHCNADRLCAHIFFEEDRKCKSRRTRRDFSEGKGLKSFTQWLATNAGNFHERVEVGVEIDTTHKSHLGSRHFSLAASECVR